MPVPQCSSLPADTDAYWECAVQHFTYPLYHDTSTAPMGPRSDPAAVVDR